MHVKHLLIDNETMSKSKGNFLTIPDLLEKGHSPQAVRYLLAGSHYRKPLNFGFEGLEGAGAALERLHGLVVRLAEVGGEGPEGPAAEACAEARRVFDASLADDLNTPEALAAVHGLVGRANALLADGALTREGAARVRAELAAMDAVFGVLLPGATRTASRRRSRLCFDERQEARRRREFAGADAARARLEALGVALEDTPKGTRWRRKR